MNTSLIPTGLRRVAAIAAAGVLAITAGFVGIAPAQAAEPFTVSVAPTTGLTPAGDDVSVTLNDLPTGLGVFVRLCKAPATANTRPLAADCDGNGKWAVENYPYGVPPTDGSVVKPSDGPVQLPVRAAFGSVNCLEDDCIIFTRRDSVGGASDFSLDTFTPVTFQQAFTVNVDPTTGLAAAGDDVTVTLNNLPTGQGVFVRLCKEPATANTRPVAADCDGTGKWAVENYPYGVPPTDGSVVKPSDGPVQLPVRAAFGTTDCLVDDCIIFTRRDSVGGASDFALDTFTPVTFAAAEFTVDVDPTTGLTAAGDEVSVTLNDLPTGQGVFVRLCKAPATPDTRPLAADCDGNGKWAVENYPYGVPPTDGSVVKPSDGPVQLPVRAAFGTTDCLVDDCIIFTRRDSVGGASDFALDTFTPVTFASAGSTEYAVDVTPTTDVVAGDEVDVTLSNVPSEVGIYVRWCVEPAEGQRADQCDGEAMTGGKWAVENYPYGPRPDDSTIVDPTEGAFPLTTTATIGDVDCAVATCGVFTRRDHQSGGDTSFDRFVPVSLKAGSGNGSGDGDGDGNGEGNSDGQATLSVTTAAVGDEVTVSGEEFLSDEPVQGTLFSDPEDLGSVNASSNGVASLTFIVPDVPAGEHTVQLEGSESGRLLTATLTVTADATPDSGTAAGALPQTGGTAAGFLPMSITFIALGVAMTAASRRLREYTAGDAA